VTGLAAGSIPVVEREARRVIRGGRRRRGASLWVTPGEGDGEHDPLGAFEAPEGEYARLKVGDVVEHDHFGRGRVELLQGSGVNARATVRFVDHGNKQLLLQYARLRVTR